MAEYSNPAEAAFLANLHGAADGPYASSNSVSIAHQTQPAGDGTEPIEIESDAADEEEDDYDPTSFVTNQTNPAPGSPTEQSLPPPSLEPQAGVDDSAMTGQNGPAKKPRTIGGFAIDDDDDEESGAPEQGTSSAQRSVTQTPNNLLSAASDSTIQKAAQSSSGLASAQSDPARTASTEFSLRSAAAPGPAEGLASNDKPSSLLPRARLPQDRVGILEDRIADDPRGDMDAWLSLISEHQKRNKLDDARAVFERFFKVFPHAVSS